MNIVHYPGRDAHMLSHATARFTADGRDLAVHAMLCGMVTVKRSHAVCCLPERTPAPLRFDDSGRPAIREPMPIPKCYPSSIPKGSSSLTPAPNPIQR